LKQFKTIRIIGAGGVTSWMLPPFLRTFCLQDDETLNKLVIQDGDILEERNLDRQLFDAKFIGVNKASALAKKYGIKQHIPYYLSTPDNVVSTLILVCVDNHTARRHALDMCDSCSTNDCIMAMNEYFDAQAVLYCREWKNTIKDPRVKYPEILTDTSANPVSCQGEAQVSSPQLCLANLMSAMLMLKLIYMWYVELPDIRAQMTDDLATFAQVLENMPIELRSSKWDFITAKNVTIRSTDV